MMGGDREDRNELIPSSTTASNTTNHPASPPPSQQPMASGSSKQQKVSGVVEGSEDGSRRPSGGHEEFHPAGTPQTDKGKETASRGAPPFTKQSSTSSLTSPHKLTQLPTKIVHKVVEKIHATTSSIITSGGSPTTKEPPVTVTTDAAYGEGS